MKFTLIVSVALLTLLSVALAEHRALPRHKAPEFTATAVVDGKFSKLSLKNYLGKWVVLMFYPFDFTFVCPTEIVSFNDNIHKFHELDAEVLAISTDSHHVHLAWIRTPRSQGGVGPLKFPLVADISKQISRNYGVLVEDVDDDMFGAALRGTFILDPNHVIRSVQINDFSAGRSVDEALRMIKAFQWSDTHGEVCPANWKPGDPTIKPTPDESKDYFRAVNKEL